jgi:outer membrane immunogenic protein
MRQICHGSIEIKADRLFCLEMFKQIGQMSSSFSFRNVAMGNNGECTVRKVMYSDCVSKRRNFFRGRLRKGVLKSAFLATATLGLVGSSAFAADLPTRKGPPPAPIYVPPPFTWTGFYVGVNAGGAWLNNNRNNNFGFPFVGAVPIGGTFLPVASGGSSNNGGFIGGIQAGYNYQFGLGSGFVIGGETDIDWADINRNRNNGILFGSFTLPQFPGTLFTPSNIAAVGHNNNNNNQYIGTVRARVGYAWDRILVFATGGLAYGGVNRNNNNTGGLITATTLSCAVCVVPLSGGATNVTGAPVTTLIPSAIGTRSSSTKTGWTVGGGVEYAFTPNWTVKAEYLYANFGHVNSAPGFVLPGAAAVFNNQNRTIDVNIVRVGVNYKFW